MEYGSPTTSGKLCSRFSGLNGFSIDLRQFCAASANLHTKSPIFLFPFSNFRIYACLAILFFTTRGTAHA